MNYQGKVEGGVIVLMNGITLPEGMSVTVVPSSLVIPGLGGKEQSTIWEKMVALARWAETQPCGLPSDLADNHDHYLHGQPKRQ